MNSVLSQPGLLNSFSCFTVWLNDHMNKYVDASDCVCYFEHEPHLNMRITFSFLLEMQSTGSLDMKPGRSGRLSVGATDLSPMETPPGDIVFL